MVKFRRRTRPASGPVVSSSPVCALKAGSSPLSVDDPRSGSSPKDVPVLEADGSEEVSGYSTDDSSSEDADPGSPGSIVGAVPAISSSLKSSPTRVDPVGKSTDASKPDSRSWRNLFLENRCVNDSTLLNHYADISSSQSCLLLAEDTPQDEWKCCLIGYVAGKFPGFKALKSIIVGIWKCEASLSIHESGWLVYRFQSEEDKNAVLKNGPVLVYGRPLILKSMPKFFNFSRSEMSSVPVWVKFPNLPLECWTSRCLSKISSLLGKPIQSDRLTASRERISYARVLVEINLMKDLPSLIKFGLPDGSTLEQPVIYESMPAFCRSCQAIGHSDAYCKKQTDRIPKANGRAGGVGPGATQAGASVKAGGVGPSAPQAGGSSDLNVTQRVQSDSTAATSEEGWVRVVGKSKSSSLEHCLNASHPAPFPVELAERERSEKIVMPPSAAEGCLPSDGLGLNLEINDSAGIPNVLNPGEGAANIKGKVVSVANDEAHELIPVEGSVNNKGKAISDLPESSSELGKRKKWKKLRKSARRGSVPCAHP